MPAPVPLPAGLSPLQAREWRAVKRRFGTLLREVDARRRSAAGSQEAAFLEELRQRIAAQRDEELGTADTPLVAEGAVHVAELPLAPLEALLVDLNKSLPLEAGRRHEAFQRLAGFSFEPGAIKAEDLVLRRAAAMMVKGWGAAEVLAAPLPTQYRPVWDLCAPDLCMIVAAREAPLGPRLRSMAQWVLVVSAPANGVPRLRADLLTGLCSSLPVAWTGLRWDEEQRLRAANWRMGLKKAKAGSPAQGPAQLFWKLDRELARLLSKYPPKAPFQWRRPRVAPPRW